MLVKEQLLTSFKSFCRKRIHIRSKIDRVISAALIPIERLNKCTEH